MKTAKIVDAAENLPEDFSLNSGVDDDFDDDLGDSAAMADSVDEESALKALLGNSPHSRMVGGTEFSWCQAVGGGTGITILGLLLSRVLDVSCLQQAIDNLQCRHPRLRSRLVWIQGKPALSVSSEPIVKVQVVEVPAPEICLSSNDTISTQEDGGVFSSESTEDSSSSVESPRKSTSESVGCSDGGDDHWLRLVEKELNTNEWLEKHHCLEPKPMFVVRLYNLTQGRSVLVLRLHTAVCDRASAATILTELLDDFHKMGAHEQEEGLEKMGDEGKFMAVEDGIPKGQANKPFWAHGVDLVGYSLGSRRHACLPFQDTQQPRRSEIVCHTLSVEHTQQLLQMCSTQRTNKLGALSAAGLKSTAIAKQLGCRNEHFAVITLLDCRKMLEPVLPSSAVGFYHSAILNTHQVNESTEFWELARRCSGALETAVRNRKHFTDMGDVNFLMCQAIQYPHLTTSSSLRTSLLVVFEGEVMDEEMEEVKKSVGVEEYVGCSSIHGVGPSIAIFDTIRQGALKSTCVYPSPLHSRAQITAFLNSMTDIIVHALQ